MNRRMRSIGAMMFILASTASAAFGQDNGPYTTRIEGNWRVTWNGFPEGGTTAANLSLWRKHHQICIKTLRGDCDFFNDTDPDEPWLLSGDWRDGQRIVPYFAAKSLSVDSFGGTVAIEHAYGALGHWGGKEQLLSAGRDDLTGMWTYGDKSGSSTWRRVEPVLHSVFAQGKTYRATGEVPNIPLHFTWNDKIWLAQNNMRGNRPKIELVLRGTDFWGDHKAFFPFSPGFEIHAINPVYLDNPTTGRPEVVGQRLRIILWPGVRPGIHPIHMGSLTIPLDLRIAGFPMNRCEQLEALITDLKTISTALAEGVMTPQLATQFGQWAGHFHRSVSTDADFAASLVEGTVAGTLTGYLGTVIFTGETAVTPAAWGPGALFGIWYAIGKRTVMQTANWQDTDRNTAFHEYILTATEYPARQRYMTEDTIDFLAAHRKDIEALTGEVLPATGAGQSIQQLRAYLDRHAFGLLYYFGLFEETQGSSKFPRHKLNVEGRYGGQRYDASYWRRVMAAELKPKIAALEVELAQARKKLCP